MMKIVGISGSNGEKSYNRQLIHYVKDYHKDLFEMDIIDNRDCPMFNTTDDQTESEFIQDVNRRILAADAVIIATPEHNFTVPPAVKSLIEYLTYNIHPLDGKPVMIIGASYFPQGTSRAQLHLRQILEAPGAGAYVFPGNEFLLGNCKNAFEDGKIKDEGTRKFLRGNLEKFISFANIINKTDANYAKEEEDAVSGASEDDDKVDALSTATTNNYDQTAMAETFGEVTEDLYAGHPVDTTIDVDQDAANWVELAAAKVNAASGSDYVRLNRGILSVDQVNYMLKTIPYEVSFIDENNQLLYYNRKQEKGAEKLSGRTPDQVGSSIGKLTPEIQHPSVSWVIEQLRSGKMNEVRVHEPSPEGSFKVHNYRAMIDADGRYRGVHELVLNLQPWVDWYFQETGGKVITKDDAQTTASVAEHKAAKDVDSTSSATGGESTSDAVTSATSRAATEAEDLYATGKIKTTIEGVDYSDHEWVEKAAEITGAVSGGDYVKLDNGVLTVDQIDWLLSELPYEATFADSNNQFIYYNYTKEKKEMLGGRQAWQVGESLAGVHPDRAFAGAAWVANQLRNGRDAVRVRIPGQPGQFKVHNYMRMGDETDAYAGIHEMIFDLQPWINWYLAVNDGHHHPQAEAEALSGASELEEESHAEPETDATSSASH